MMIKNEEIDIFENDNDLAQDTLAGAHGEIISALDIQNIPDEKRWLVLNLIRRNTVAVIDGMGSTGKSLIATQLAISVAGGWPFLGHFVVPQRGKVAYINAEDPRKEAWLRIKNIAKNYDSRQIREAAMNIRIFFTCDIIKHTGTTIMLDRNMQPTPFLDAVVDFCKRWQPDLLVFDPLGRFIYCENDNAYAAQLYTQLHKLNTTILFVHHDNKLAMRNNDEYDDRAKARGASNWVEMAKTRLYLKSGEIKVDKCNYCYENQGKKIKLVYADDMFHAASKLTDEESEENEEEPRRRRGRKPTEKGVIYA